MSFETDFDSKRMTHYCFVDQPTTYSNLDEYVPMLYNDDRSEFSLVEISYQWCGEHSTQSLS